jgi:F-type H+-transporting ATPase subunit epsilon
MANNSFQFILMSPEKVVFDQAVIEAKLRAESGDLGILPGHVRLIAPIKVSPVRLTLESGQVQKFLVHGGTINVTPEKTHLLCDNVEKAEEINAEQARKTKDELENKLRGGVKPEEEFQLRRELEVAKARIELTSRHGH